MRPFYDSERPHVSPRGSLAPPCPDHVDPVVLAPATLHRHPVPAGARFVLPSFDGDVWLRAGDGDDSIAAPSATATTGLAGELAPGARRIPVGATHILLIAEAACKGSLAFYG